MGRFPVVTVGAAVGCLICWSSVVSASPASVAAGSVPEVVSPGGAGGEAVVEARCPTFSWAGIEGARGYDIVVLAVPGPVDEQEELGEPQPLARASVSAGARSWTPSLGSCLSRGGRYAWSVRAVLAGAEGAWSEPALFAVAGAPSVEEVEAALETLRRYRQEVAASEPPPVAAALAPPERPGSAARLAALAGPPELVQAAAPVLGNPSLSVSANIALGPASNIFKSGEVFLWDDASGNFAAGHRALASASGNASGNTAVGRFALENTTEGAYNSHGSYNTSLGGGALRYNTTGFDNTASGFAALFSNITGRDNTASGTFALFSNTTGSRNTAVGRLAGSSATTGDDNIYLGYGASGTAGEGNTIRIGGLTGTDFGQQNRAFIAGITGITVSGSQVLVSSDNQLGVSSSSQELKEAIEELGEVSGRLAGLRPVSFRYRSEVLPGGGPQVGLIAEEVAELFPELVGLDEQGHPISVRYDLLSVLLLSELQREHERNDAQERELQEQARELAALLERLAALEARSGAPPP
jgi:hypothetical protein